MPKVHIVNVAPGDCTIIEHASGRYTVMDICSGNMETEKTEAVLVKASESTSQVKPGGNFRMCERLTNPIVYLKQLGAKKIWRFILSHPDMDHMDGLSKLHEEIGFNNFWDSGFRRTTSKPEFDNGFNRYKKEDWDLYESLINNKVSGVTVLNKLAGARFALANEKDESGNRHDGLHILAPNKELLGDPNEADDINESSYVIEYSSAAGPILLPGDAHDASWDLVMEDKSLKNNCAFLLAPHHGRDSGRSYDFLDYLQPKLTVLGCSPSQHLAYSEWSNRGLSYITSNQAGNIVLDIKQGYYNVYIENRKYAEACGCDLSLTNNQGYYLWATIRT